jgi:hypothetical protein
LELFESAFDKSVILLLRFSSIFAVVGRDSYDFCVLEENLVFDGVDRRIGHDSN